MSNFEIDFIAKRSRGGLSTPNEDMISIFVVVERIFRNHVYHGIREIPANEIICEATRNNKVKTLWENMLFDNTIEVDKLLYEQCLKTCISLFVKVQIKSNGLLTTG